MGEDHGSHWKLSVWCVWPQTFSHLFVGRGHRPCTQIINLLSTPYTSQHGWQRGKETQVSCMRGVSSTKMLPKKLSNPERCLHLTFKSSKGLTLIDSYFLLYGKHFPSGSPTRLNQMLRIICKCCLTFTQLSERARHGEGIWETGVFCWNKLFFKTPSQSREFDWAFSPLQTP